jgi:hypothetical protein
MRTAREKNFGKILKEILKKQLALRKFRAREKVKSKQQIAKSSLSS